MKKLILTVLMLVCLVFQAEAQKDFKNAIGLRVGDNSGIGAEISYQRDILTNNRLEFDLGWRNSRNIDAVKLAALFQWVWNIDGGFNWYAGVGGGFGSYDYNYNRYYYGPAYRDDHGNFAFVAGDIGIEYNFDIPLQLSFDVRPEIGGTPYYENSIAADIGLGIRYRF